MRWLTALIVLVVAAVAACYVYRVIGHPVQGQTPAKQQPDTMQAPPVKEEPAAPSKPVSKAQPAPKVTSAPEQKPEASNQAEKPAAGPSTPQRIRLPSALAKAQFGMSPKSIAARYRIAWERVEQGKLMLVHNIRQDTTQKARFHFERDKLNRIELIYQPRKGQSVNELYSELQGQCYERYKDLPGSRRTRWSDGSLNAGIRMEDGAVKLYFSVRKK